MATSYDTEIDSEPYTDSSVQNSTSQGSRQRILCSNRIVGNSFEELSHLMSSDLKKPIFEILILYRDNDDDNEDEKKARDLQKSLSENVKYKKGREEVRPTVELLSDVILESSSATEELDFPLSKTLFVFLLATPSACCDDWTLFKGHATLKSSLDRIKSHFLIVIHTQHSSNRTYSLPVMLSSARSLEYYQTEYALGKLYDRVKRMLESQVATLLEKERVLHEKRFEFLKTYYPKELREFLGKDNARQQQAQTLPRSRQMNKLTGVVAVRNVDQGYNDSSDFENESSVVNVSTDSDSRCSENVGESLDSGFPSAAQSVYSDILETGITNLNIS